MSQINWSRQNSVPKVQYQFQFNYAFPGSNKSKIKFKSTYFILIDLEINSNHKIAETCLPTDKNIELKKAFGGLTLKKRNDH